MSDPGHPLAELFAIVKTWKQPQIQSQGIEQVHAAAPLPGVCMVTENSRRELSGGGNCSQREQGVRGKWMLFARCHPGGAADGPELRGRQEAPGSGRPAGDTEGGGSEPRSSAAITTCRDVARDAWPGTGKCAMRYASHKHRPLPLLPSLRQDAGGAINYRCDSASPALSCRSVIQQTLTEQPLCVRP